MPALHHPGVLPESVTALVKGGGDLGTGVSLRLKQNNYNVVVSELPEPLAVRRAVALASAVFEGRKTISGQHRPGRAAHPFRATTPSGQVHPECSDEGVGARLVHGYDDIHSAWRDGDIPVIVGLEAGILQMIQPLVIVDGIMAKRNTGTKINDAPIVIALGPGFTAGVDCHAVIETQRGPDLGNIYYTGTVAPDSGIPGEINGETTRRILRAPVDGIFVALKNIGDHVHTDEIIAQVYTGLAAQNNHPVRSRLNGVIRGIMANGLPVTAGLKVGDIDPRDDPALCFQVSDKAWKIGDSVLKAIGVLRQLA